MNFGMRLKELRTGNDLTQLQMSQVLDTSKSNISKYEAGSVEPNLQTLIKMSEYFGVSIDYLLGINDSDEQIENKRGRNFFFFFDDLLKEVFTTRFSKALTHSGMSKETFSIKSNINIEDCEAYILGDMAPSAEELISISQSLGVSIDYLLGQCTDRSDNLISVFKNLNEDNRDIIIGEAKKLLKEQRYEDSVAAESKMKEAK